LLKPLTTQKSFKLRLRIIYAFLKETFFHMGSDSIIDMKTGKVIARGPNLNMKDYEEKEVEMP